MQFIQIISVLFIIIILFHSLVFSPFETNKTYDVMNNQGQRIYFAEEKSNCFIRHLCGPSRPFTMTIYDNVGCDVITLHKALRWSCCWSNCCLQKVSKYYLCINIWKTQITRWVSKWPMQDVSKYTWVHREIQSNNRVRKFSLIMDSDSMCS